MQSRKELTFRARIFVAGCSVTARQLCRHYCNDVGLCVTVSECDFIYTNGAERGVEVGLVNYPRFPSSPDEIRDKAKGLAEMLLAGLCQSSALIVDDVHTEWITTREIND